MLHPPGDGRRVIVAPATPTTSFGPPMDVKYVFIYRNQNPTSPGATGDHTLFFHHLLPASWPIDKCGSSILLRL